MDYKVKKQVFKNWKGRCGFCGEKLSIEQHHIVAKSDNPKLENDPENLILLCSNHHSLTLKKKPNNKPMLSFEDIGDLIKSKYKNSDKQGVNINLPNKNLPIIIGLNNFHNSKYIIAVNKKPLIETCFKKPVHYAPNKTFLLFIRLFDKNNNFIGGLFGDYWASVQDVSCELKIEKNRILAQSNNEVWIEILISPKVIIIRGLLYFDGIKIDMTKQPITLNNYLHIAMLSFKNNECALRIYGNKYNTTYEINGKLDD